MLLKRQHMESSAMPISLCERTAEKATKDTPSYAMLNLKRGAEAMTTTYV